MPTILMVDDDTILLDLYREVLLPDFSVLTACTVDEAIELLAGEPVDAVGCDYHLGNGLGLDVVAWIAAHSPGLLEKTMLISGVDAPPMHGFHVRCLYKPISMGELLDIFHAWLSPAEED